MAMPYRKVMNETGPHAFGGIGLIYLGQSNPSPINLLLNKIE